ncbi:MAG: serine hydrolase [Roseinatronobacter sp.]
MQALVRVIRHLLITCVIFVAFVAGGSALAAPYAAYVIDARTGEVLFARNHDTKLHPASLTKMMTLYVAFEAIKHGELSLDTMVTVSRRATQTECVCLGLRPGQRISMRNLIRAAALRSANDATVVIAEAISGSVEDFARRMTRTARAMGMSNTTFLNPHGLTQPGHISSAKDMTILGRQLFFDYPQYYNMFSRRSEQAGNTTIANTNRRFLESYQGADGIKTGFTRAAGFNLTASARRGDKHIIATMFGGTSTAARNAHVSELLDNGFAKARTRVAARPPATPAYQGRGSAAVAVAQAQPEVNMTATPTDRPAAARTIRLQTAVRSSPFPRPRPDRTDPAALIASVKQSVENSVAEIAKAVTPPAPAPAPAASGAQAASSATPPPPRRPEGLGTTPPSAPEVNLAAAQAAGFTLAAPQDLAALDLPSAPPEVAIPQEPPVVEPAASETAPDMQMAALPSVAPSADVTPPARPAQIVAQATPLAPEPVALAAPPEAEPEILWSGAADSVVLTEHHDQMQMAHVDLDVMSGAGPEPVTTSPPSLILTRAPDPATPAPAPDRTTVQATAQVAEAHANPDLEIISRLSTSDGGRIWGVSLGEFTSRSAAERGLITVKMAEAHALGNGISRINQRGSRFEAAFAGLTSVEAERACLRLQARGMDCRVAAP